ncbi:MAG: PepSY domain-containing protein [Tannerellaceae bacterium]|nr:PepSY domain-containing protein [Tannerellaceae bacterium]MCD8263964.1 PepSY domain-containing protein [Tannerellaceae bacterium]
MKKIFTKLHLWLSIPFGIFISVLCLTGGLLVFETEIQQVANPSRFYVKEVKGAPLPLEELIPMVQQQLPDTVSISGITFPAKSNQTYRMSMTGMGRTSLIVDPYTAEIIEQVTPYAKGNFFSAVRRLHRWFMYPMQRDKTNWGKILTGTSTLIFVFILITGIIIWIPKSVKMLKRCLKIKTGSGSFRFWYDLHLAGGIYTAILLLTMALTGLTWSFQWYRTGFYKVFGVETTQGSGHGQPAPNQQPNEPTAHATTNRPSGNEREQPNRSEGRPEGNETVERNSRPERNTSGEDTHERGGESREGRRGGERSGQGGRGPDYAVWTNVYNQLAQQYPAYKTISVQSGTATVSAATTGNTRASDRYTFDNRTGEITHVQLYKDNPKSSKIRGWIYAVHVGSWGGILTRILYFIACLVGTCLPLTGYYFYLKKRSLKKKKEIKEV